MTREEFVRRWARGEAAMADDLTALLDAERANAVAEALGPIAAWPVVLEFAQAMARKLDHHKPKKGAREGWASDEPGRLLLRLRQEVDELDGALYAEADPGEILAEAADVANMAMMVADANCPLERTAPKEEEP